MCAENVRFSYYLRSHTITGKAEDGRCPANGKAIRIEGGNYEMAVRRFRCGNGHEWEVPFEVMIKKPPELCPTCNISDIMVLSPWRPGWGMGGKGRQFRGRRNW